MLPVIVVVVVIVIVFLVLLYLLCTILHLPLHFLCSTISLSSSLPLSLLIYISLLYSVARSCCSAIFYAATSSKILHFAVVSLPCAAPIYTISICAYKYVCLHSMCLCALCSASLMSLLLGYCHFYILTVYCCCRFSLLASLHAYLQACLCVCACVWVYIYFPILLGSGAVCRCGCFICFFQFFIYLFAAAIFLLFCISFIPLFQLPAVVAFLSFFIAAVVIAKLRVHLTAALALALRPVFVLVLRIFSSFFVSLILQFGETT